MNTKPLFWVHVVLAGIALVKAVQYVHALPQADIGTPFVIIYLAFTLVTIWCSGTIVNNLREKITNIQTSRIGAQIGSWFFGVLTIVTGVIAYSFRESVQPKQAFGIMAIVAIVYIITTAMLKKQEEKK